jgi:tRNA/rRNA methyltransferase
MPRLNQLFNRAAPTQEEIHILRGIAKAVLQQSAQVQGMAAPASTNTRQTLD